jgi:predicted DCC family thiol-disulfide oxidoreductase YuxK
MIDIPKNKDLILFDGVCNLCHNSVQYVIERDTHNRFVFASLQSNLGQQVLKHHNINPDVTDSIILYRHNKGIKIKSTAALLIANKLGLPSSLLSVFLIIPPFLRHLVYDFIAINRYRWFGKQESCWLPTAELKAKFLD